MKRLNHMMGRFTIHRKDLREEDERKSMPVCIEEVAGKTILDNAREMVDQPRGQVSRERKPWFVFVCLLFWFVDASSHL